MNIVHVYKTFLNSTFGGVEQTIFQIAKGNGSDFKHTVLSLSPSQENTERVYKGVNTICYKEDFSIASSSFSFSLWRDFTKITENADVIHYHFPWPFADLLHLTRRIKNPSIVTYHSDIVRQRQLLFFYRPLMNRFLSSVDRIIATSPNYLKSSQVLQKYKHKVTTIPIGLDKGNYPEPSPEHMAYWRNQFGSRFFLFIGVLRYYKGLHILLQAMQNTVFPVLIVGTGPMEEELKAYARKLELGNVYFLGSLSEQDKVALLHLCSSVIFPSHLRSEAFGISLLEGAMAGKPLISSEIGTGTSYINIHGETGLVVPPSDPIALRDAMHYLWNNPEKCIALGKGAEARYKELFTGEQMVLGYEKVYRELIRNKAKSG
jgi:glycosyltransferase involved in cell wall biosynthesis